MTSNKEPLKMKKKRVDIDGWCPAILDTHLKNMNKNKHAGDWQRDSCPQLSLQGGYSEVDKQAIKGDVYF